MGTTYIAELYCIRVTRSITGAGSAKSYIINRKFHGFFGVKYELYLILWSF